MSEEKQLQEVETRLRASMHAAIAAGWKLRRQVMYDVWDKCCCAIGSVACELFAQQLIPAEVAGGSVYTHVGAALGINQDQLYVIAYGFDGWPKCTISSVDLLPWHALGVKLAAEFEVGPIPASVYTSVS